MDLLELQEIVARGEDGQHQFKEDVRNAASLAAEFVAFSNSGGGLLLIGVSDEGGIPGLSSEDVARINKLISNTASQNVRPSVSPTTENVRAPGGIVIVVKVAVGLSKPYADNTGLFWVKSGADKRKVTAPEELRRMFQSAAQVHADELPAKGLTVADFDKGYFSAFFERFRGETLESQQLPLRQLLENMNLMRSGVLNLCGALLFAKEPQLRLPVFIVKAVAYPGVTPDEETYLDSRDITGKLADVFQQGLSFLLANLKHVQGDGDVNSAGKPEIPRVALEELLVNALIHRDYFISAPIRLFVYRDRVEIISPGHLPNNLTVENIRLGNSNIRNPILASFAPELLLFRGLGSGVVRAINAYPAIQFVDDRDGNQFKVTLLRQ